VTEREARGAALGDELAAVDGSVMGRAKGHEVFGVVRPAVGFRVDVVEVDEDGVSASGNLATAAVAVVDDAANRRRNGLCCARRCVTHVGRFVRWHLERLRVACGHFEDFIFNGNELSPCVRGSALAAFAHGERHLIARRTRVTWRAENPMEIGGEDAQRMQKLLDVLEDLDDTQAVYHNAVLE